ncbi:MAG: Ku protein [Myxococcaceae bacterium]|nr:Ku protein [Myxococcaceae bacterium]
MPRAMWSGAISFGLVNIPVKLYPATSHKEVQFHMLHKKDGARIKQKRVCSAEDKEVDWDEIAKGYEVAPGRYVMLEREEIAALNPKADRSITIEDFVHQEEIDPIYYESAYYVVPDRGAARPYKLLLEALRRTNKVGIARVVLRTRQYLCAVRPVGDGLELSTMLYADEVNPVEDLEELPDKSVHPGEREVKMAEQLIESLSTTFDPRRYKDEHREQVLALIQRKAEGEEIVAPVVKEEPARVVNLMDALQKSLERLKERGPQAGEPAEETGERRHRAEAAHGARSGSRAKKKSGNGAKKKKSSA